MILYILVHQDGLGKPAVSILGTFVVHLLEFEKEKVSF
jgi:hypothetical protein